MGHIAGVTVPVQIFGDRDRLQPVESIFGAQRERHLHEPVVALLQGLCAPLLDLQVADERPPFHVASGPHAQLDHVQGVLGGDLRVEEHLRPVEDEVGADLSIQVVEVQGQLDVRHGLFPGGDVHGYSFAHGQHVPVLVLEGEGDGEAVYVEVSVIADGDGHLGADDPVLQGHCSVIAFVHVQSDPAGEERKYAQNDDDRHDQLEGDDAQAGGHEGQLHAETQVPDD